MVWVLTEIWDDGDPGDHASLQNVHVFTSLEGVRGAFSKLNTEHKGGLSVMGDPDDLEADFPEAEGFDEITKLCLQTPELYCWASGRDTGDDDGWAGGYLIEISAVEVQP